MGDLHVHSCPECHEKPLCSDGCPIEPDLGTTSDGVPFGHHHVCVKCERTSRDNPPAPLHSTREEAQRECDRVLAFLDSAPPDEIELLGELVRRIEAGRRAYGAWVAGKEKRDLVQEEHEEHLDGLVYSSMRRVWIARGLEKGGGR